MIDGKGREGIQVDGDATTRMLSMAMDCRSELGRQSRPSPT